LIVLWQYRDKQTNWWCYGSILSGVGVVLVGSRGFIPDILSYQVAQALAIFGAWSRIWAIRFELPQRNNYLGLIYFVIYGAYIIGFHLFIDLEINSRARLIYTNIFFIFATIDFGYINYKLKKLHPNRLSFLILLNCAIFQVLSFGYATYTLTQQPAIGFSFTYTTYHYVLLISLLILTIFANYAFLRLKIEKISEKHTDEQVTLAKQLISQEEAVKYSIAREQLMKQINKSTRASTLGMFASAIAHEINQPLASIRLNAQLLMRSSERGYVSPSDYLAAMSRIISDNERASDIIKTLRTLLIDGPESNTVIDLNHITREIIPSSNLQNHTEDIKLILELSDKEMLVFGNKTQLQLAILNLINNAIDALKESTHQKNIRISSREGSDHNIELSIEDSGDGISEEQIAFLFQPFSTSKKYGMGVGLAISQSIANNHYGVIKAENITGSGAKFTLSIPTASRGEEFFKNKESQLSAS
jgi:signal transduction histidine kinase